MQVRYFAWIRDRIGVAEEEIEPPEHVQTVGELTQWLMDRHPAFGTAVDDYPELIRTAVNFEFCGPDRKLVHYDEIAYFPPITGG